MSGQVTDRARKVLETLEFVLAPDFARSVEAHLRTLDDGEVNALYLLTHTDNHLGDAADVLTAVLMPLIEREQDLRRDIAIVPSLGPILAPDRASNVVPLNRRKAS